jgi:hypothetical protein
VTADIQQLHDRPGGKRTPAKENISPSLLLVEPTQHRLQFSEISEARNPWKVQIRAHSAQKMSRQWTLAVWPVDIDANDKRHAIVGEPYELANRAMAHHPILMLQADLQSKLVHMSLDIPGGLRLIVFIAATGG